MEEYPKWAPVRSPGGVVQSSGPELRLSPTSVAAYCAAGIVAILAPIWIAAHPSGFVAYTRGPGYVAYELFGLTASLLVLAFGARSVWKVRGLPRREAFVRLLPVLLPGLIGLQYLQLISEFSDRSWDWTCYERATSVMLAGRSLYDGVPSTATCTGYLYPPLFAELLALLQSSLGRILPWLGGTADVAPSATMYVYQCAQLFALQACVYLCFRFGLGCGLSPMLAAGAVGACFALGNPFVRTLHNDQVNLWVMALVLGAVDRLATRPLWAGGFVALAFHIKLHPAVLLGPWLADRRWRAVAAALAIGAAIVGVELAAHGSGRHWTEFLVAVTSPPAELPDDAPLDAAPLFRNGSLWAVGENAARLVFGTFGASPGTIRLAARVCGSVAVLAALVWLGRRALRRRRAGVMESPLLGDTVDALTLPLLCAPLVWEHHYVMAVPLALYALACGGSRRPFWIAAAALLVFALPTFDVFPLSYHRLAGVWMLLRAAEPTPPDPPDPPDAKA